MLKAQWQNVFQYRAMIFIWMFETFFVPFVMLLVWQPIVQVNESLQQQAQVIINYYLLLPLTTLISGAWNGIFFAGKVRSGELNTFLTKPTHHLWFDITNNLTEKLLKLLLFIPIATVATVFFTPQLPAQSTIWLAFLIVLLLSVVMNFILDVIVGYLAFWLDDISGLINAIDISEYTLGGRSIPFFLFPQVLQSFAFILPFRYLRSFPAEILSGAIAQTEITAAMQVMLAWILFGIAISAVLWRKGIKKYSAYSG